MKKITLLFCLFISFFAANAQNEIMLHLSPRLGSETFALNKAVNHPGGTYQVKYTRFEYYISEIKITHDGGIVTPVTDLYLLARPAIDTMYSLGVINDVQNIESITFSIGVDAAHNHLDPTSFPANHPLAPQNPAMQWGWTAGYRFAAIEGVAGTNFAQSFEVHALGDANYKTVTLPTVAEQVNPDMKMIHVAADYGQVLKNINVSSGLIVHGTSGAAVTLLNNFKNIVFTSSAASGVTDPGFSGSFSVSPNPATNTVPQVNFSLPAGSDYTVTVTDLCGKVLFNKSLDMENQSLLLENLPTTGVFFAHLWQNDKPVAVEKLVILH